MSWLVSPLWAGLGPIGIALTSELVAACEAPRRTNGCCGVAVGEGALRLTDIAVILEVGKPSLSRQITALERLGLVRCETDPVDARVRMITLTSTGNSRLEAVQHAGARVFQRLLAGWDIDDLTTLTDLASRLNSIYNRGEP